MHDLTYYDDRLFLQYKENVLCIYRPLVNYCPIGSVKSGAVPSDFPDCSENNCINKLNVVLLFKSVSSI